MSTLGIVVFLLVIALWILDYKGWAGALLFILILAVIVG